MLLEELLQRIKGQDFGPKDSMVVSSIAHPVKAADKLMQFVQNSMQTAAGMHTRESLADNPMPWLAPSREQQVKAGLDLAGLLQTGAMPFGAKGAGTLGSIRRPQDIVFPEIHNYNMEGVRRLSPEDFRKLAPQNIPDLTKIAHLYRGATGYLDKPGQHVKLPEEPTSFLEKLLTAKAKDYGEFSDLLDDVSIGFEAQKNLFEPTKQTLNKVMYVSRDAPAKLKAHPESVVSAQVIDPKLVDSYAAKYNSNEASQKAVYKLPVGAEYYHPGGLADTNEVLLKASALEQAQRLNAEKLIRRLKRKQ